MGRLLLALGALVLGFWGLSRALKPQERRTGREPGDDRDGTTPRKMVRDPQCGTYIPRERALTERAGGESHYFCSDECRDAWREREAEPVG